MQQKRDSEQDREMGRLVSDKGKLGEEVRELQYFGLSSFIA